MWKKLNHILIEKGMTKKELAEKAGISKNTIQNIRNSKISFRNMVKIADALDVSLDEFRKGGGVLQWTLEAMRINKGLTQLELAEKFEVSSQTIARLEKDSSDIGYQLLKKYMDYFNVKFDDIFLGKKYENFVNQPN